MPPLRPTLRSLAAEAGVSLTTMSFALRNSPEISPATTARLQRLATARGYRPDPQVAKLMAHLRMRAAAKGRANLCGLMNREAYKSAPRGGYIERLLTGIKARAESLGYCFSTASIADYPRPGQLERMLVNRGVEGLLVLPMGRPIDLTTLLDWSKFSVLSISPALVAPHFHTVTPHHFDNMVTACKELERAGFRRIAMAMSRDWDVRTNHRWTGGVAWQNEFGGTEPVKSLIERIEGPRLSPAVFKRWLRAARPDALVVETVDASTVDRALKEVHRKFRPALVTMNWPNPMAKCGVDQQVERIGAVAIEMLAAMLNRGERGPPDNPTDTMIRGIWIESARATGA